MNSSAPAQLQEEPHTDTHPPSSPSAVVTLPAPEQALDEATAEGLHLTPEGAGIVSGIRCGDPLRRPHPGAQNWAGSEYLDLMGFTIGVTSRTLSRAMYRLVPRQADILEMYDHPYALRVKELHPDGRLKPPRDVIPHALAIRQNRVHFIDVQRWTRVAELAETRPDWYCLGNDGRWHCPAAERALRETGIGYEVYTDRDINSIRLRNVNFLRDFEDDPGPGADLILAVDRALDADPIQTLEHLIGAVCDRRAVYWSIVHEPRVFFDLDRDLCNEDRSPVYRSRLHWEADVRVRLGPHREMPSLTTFELSPHAVVTYLEQRGEIVEANATAFWVRCLNGNTTQLFMKDLPSLLLSRQLALEGTAQDLRALGWKLLLEATIDKLQRAVAAHDAIKAWVVDAKVGGTTRTQRRHIAAYRLAEGILGIGLVGLLDHIDQRGNRTSRLTELQEEGIRREFKDDYLTSTAPSIRAAVAKLNVGLLGAKEERVGRKAFTKRLNKIPPHERDRLRYGDRMGNVDRPPLPPSDQPPKGERPFEVAMIDSFTLPQRVLSRRTWLPLKKTLWATLLWNVYPPYPLGLHIRPRKPSNAAVMATLRDCVRRHHRLPREVSCDLGAEHHHLTFDLFRAAYGIDFLDHPGGNPRFTGDIETHIGCLKILAREYKGAYKAIPRRGGSHSHDPDNITPWFYEDLVEDLFTLVFTDWPNMDHDGIAGKPGDIWTHLLHTQGDRPTRYVEYDEALQVLSMPILKAHAHIEPGRGIQFDYVWYDDRSLHVPEWDDKYVVLREPLEDDPFLVAQLGKRWVKCAPSSYVFKTLSQRDIGILREEWIAEKSGPRDPTAFENFVKRIRAKEASLERERIEAATSARPAKEPEPPAGPPPPAACDGDDEDKAVSGVADLHFTPSDSY